MKCKLLAGFALVALLTGCGDMANPGSPAARDKLDARAQTALGEFINTDATLNDKIHSAYAYVVFPEVATGGLGVGAAHGNGEVFQSGKLIGYADMSQASIGAQAGGQTYSELILLRNQAALTDLQGGVEFDARVSAVAAKDGAARSADYERGVMVFVIPRGGLMVQAAVGGQKFRYTPVAQASNY